MHCEQTQPTTKPYPPFECGCGSKDWRLLIPTTKEEAETPLYLQALFKKNKNAGREAITNLLIKNFHFKTITGNKSERVWVYEKGVYTPKGADAIRIEIEKILGDDANNQQVSEIVGKIARKTIVRPRELEQENPYLICVKNGIINLHDGSFQEHTPDIPFIIQLPVDYDPDAECPRIKQILMELLEHEDIPTFIEFAGYCLFKEYKYKKAVLLLGQRDSGKTLLLNLLTAFLGEENIAGESLQKIMNDRFSAFNLIGKYANFYDDLSARDFYDAGAFKVATGGGYINAEQKFSDAIRYKNTAKLGFATNEVALPKESADDAYYSRWLVFRFLQQFGEGNQKTNKNLLEEITTPNELSGFLKIAIKGFQRLERQQSFSYKKTSEEVKLIMHESGDVISAFVQNCLIESEGNLIPKEVMYNAFLAWCSTTKRMSVTKDLIGKRLRVAAPYIMEGKRLVGVKRLPCWVNVTFNNAVPSVIPFLKSIPTFLDTSSSLKVYAKWEKGMPAMPQTNLNPQKLPLNQDKVKLTDFLVGRNEVTLKEVFNAGFTQEDVDKVKLIGDVVMPRAGFIALTRPSKDLTDFTEG